MATKTITVTEEAYKTLDSLKRPRESFSETIKRIAKRKPLSTFFGVLSKESGEKLENTILEIKTKKERRMESESRLISINKPLQVSDVFGTLKGWKRPTQEIKNELKKE